MPFDASRYPANWKEISLAIRERDHWRCKFCGAVNGQPHPVTKSKVVLTVAHLGIDYPDGRPGNKHDKQDVRPENLAALCQSCHLNYDRDEHKANAAYTRWQKKIEAGQGFFLEMNNPREA
jgi:5-methylcytosine-specific restriction endonuclease McrA